MAVTIKNTKQEILDALDVTSNKLKALQQGKSEPAKEAAVAKVEKAIESAKESVDKNIFSSELNEKYTDLVEAIAAQEAKLTELYGVEAELQSLTVVVNAHKDTIAALESDKKDREERIDSYIDAKTFRLDAEIMEFRNKINDEEATLRKNLSDMKASLDQERKREKEEYSYNLSRERSKEEDTYQDMKAEREAAIASAEAAVDAKWDEVKAKSDYTVELEVKVAGIPTLIEEAKSVGAAEATKELGKEYGYKKSMADREHEYAVSRLQDKVVSLESELTKSQALNVSLQTKLEAAYEKVQEIATKTVEANGKINIIGSNQDTRK